MKRARRTTAALLVLCAAFLPGCASPNCWEGSWRGATKACDVGLDVAKGVRGDGKLQGSGFDVPVVLSVAVIGFGVGTVVFLGYLPYAMTEGALDPPPDEISLR